MFIKITKNKNESLYYHLVESYRDQGKVRQRTLLSLGKIGEDGLDKLIRAIGKHKDILTVTEAVKSVDNDIKGNSTKLLKAIGEPVSPKLLKYTSPPTDQSAL